MGLFLPGLHVPTHLTPKFNFKLPMVPLAPASSRFVELLLGALVMIITTTPDLLIFIGGLVFDCVQTVSVVEWDGSAVLFAIIVVAHICGQIVVGLADLGARVVPVHSFPFSAFFGLAFVPALVWRVLSACVHGALACLALFLATQLVLFLVADGDAVWRSLKVVDRLGTILGLWFDKVRVQLQIFVEWIPRGNTREMRARWDASDILQRTMYECMLATAAKVDEMQRSSELQNEVLSDITGAQNTMLSHSDEQDARLDCLSAQLADGQSAVAASHDQLAEALDTNRQLLEELTVKASEEAELRAEVAQLKRDAAAREAKFAADRENWQSQLDQNARLFARMAEANRDWARSVHEGVGASGQDSDLDSEELRVVVK